MKAFSFLDIPDYQIEKMKRKFIGVSIDYRRFSFSSLQMMDKYLMKYLSWHKAASNASNGSVSYNWDGYLISRQRSPRWDSYQLIVWIEWVWPVPIIYFEIYKPDLAMGDSVGRFDFYGAFFHFRDQFDTLLSDMYESMSIEVKSTRCDVAFDFEMPIIPSMVKWIKPSRNSKRHITPYINSEWNISWLSYLTTKNSGYWVRFYDKRLDTASKGKKSWYWHMSDREWSRIEFELYPPYSIDSDSGLINLCSAWLGGMDISMGLHYRPCPWYLIPNAYTYFQRYCKNQWIPFETMLDDLTAYHITFLSHGKK